WGSALLSPLKRLKPWPHFFDHWGQFVVRRAWGCVAVGLIVLTVLAIPFLRLQIASVEAKNIPSRSESRQGYESLSDNLGAGWMMPAIILVQHPTKDWMNGDGLAQEKNLVDRLTQLPNTEKVLTVTDNSGSRRAQQTRMGLLTSFNDTSQSAILMLSRTDPQSPTARDWLDPITALLKNAEKTEPDGS